MVIQPSMWGVLGLFALMSIGNPVQNIMGVLLYMMAGFLTLLTHEMGHALVGRSIMKGNVAVYMAWLGGVTEYDGPTPSRWQGLFMTCAGPLASLLLVPVAMFIMNLYVRDISLVLSATWEIICGGAPRELVDFLPFNAFILLCFLILLSVWWSVLNLLPVYPLDGGRILSYFVRSERRLYTISMVIAALLSLFAFANGLIFLGVLLIFLVVSNYRAREEADD